MNIGFIMYPWERIEAETDSTIRLIHEAARRGHKVGIIHPTGLTIRDTMVHATTRILKTKADKVSSNIPAFHKKAEFTKQMIPLSGFDVLFIRDNPPLDPIMLNFLDSVKGDTLMINDIDGLRKANNKIYTAAFEGEFHDFIPQTHVSKNKEYLLRVIEESPTDKVILKPLDGFGGSGVIILEKSAKHNVNSLLDFYIDEKGRNNYVIIQEFVETDLPGDVRVLMLNGEPIGAMRRVPAEGEHRSNVHAGGTVKKHSLSKIEKKLCQQIGPKLVEDGLYFVGLDIIGGKLIEVNVCSPGGIMRINKLNRVRLQDKVINFAEDIVNRKEAAISRKEALRKAVSDASDK